MDLGGGGVGGEGEPLDGVERDGRVGDGEAGCGAGVVEEETTGWWALVHLVRGWRGDLGGLVTRMSPRCLCWG